MPTTELNHHLAAASLGRILAMLLLLLFASNGMAADRPCWLTNLSPDNQKLMYGAASKFSASLLPAHHFSRLNALNNWALSEGKGKVSVQRDLSKLQTFMVHGERLFFLDEYEDETAVYSLVSSTRETKLTQSSCPISSCEPASCAPDWLCEQDQTPHQLFAISAPTGHPNGQIRHILENAQSLISTANKVLVEGRVRLLNIDTQYEHQANIQQQYKITKLDDAVSAVKVANLCHYKGNLVSQILFNQIDLPLANDWMKNPNWGDNTGAVGHAKGQTSTGRLSDLLALAVRRGLFELAKAKQIRVDNRLEMTSRSQGSFSLIRVSEQKTESVISAFIADIKMELNDNIQPEIYVWLLENKGDL